MATDDLEDLGEFPDEYFDEDAFEETMASMEDLDEDEEEPE